MQHILAYSPVQFLPSTATLFDFFEELGIDGKCSLLSCLTDEEVDLVKSMVKKTLAGVYRLTDPELRQQLALRRQSELREQHRQLIQQNVTEEELERRARDREAEEVKRITKKYLGNRWV